MRRNQSSKWKKSQLQPIDTNEEIQMSLEREIEERERDERERARDGDRERNILGEREKSFSSEKMNKSPSYRGINNLSVPPSPFPGQDDGEKHAGASFDYDELFDLNSPTFW